jgi:K+-transporting ATPase ATPase C chain
MLTEITRGMRFTIVTMVLFGGVYPAVLWVVGQVAFPSQAEGSLNRRSDGTVVGSRLVGQNFTGNEYFHPRPSAVDYNAASGGGSNYGPSNPEYLAIVRERVATVAAREGVAPSQIPAEMVTASAGGLDPHLSLAAADIQVARVARARRLPVERIREMIDAHTELPFLGLFGSARVNVLELNLALDR